MEKEMQTPSEKNFNLSKVKLNPAGGLSADYQVTETVGGEPSVTDYCASVSREIHPDLKECFDDLRTIVARVFNITSFLTLLESEDMKLPASKMLTARAFAQELISKIDVRGVSWSGTDDNAGVVITAVFETPNGLKTCINTPRIKLAQISFGFEEELETIVNEIKKEVYAFLFKGKQAQLSLFGEQAPAGESGTAANDDNDMPEM